MNMHTLGLIIHAKCPVKMLRCTILSVSSGGCLAVWSPEALSPFLGCKVLSCQMATVIGCQWPYLVRVRRA